MQAVADSKPHGDECHCTGIQRLSGKETEGRRWAGDEACLLELGGAEVNLVGGVLLLHDLLEGVVGSVRLAVKVALQSRHIMRPSDSSKP